MKLSPIIQLFFGAVCIGFAPIFVKLVPMEPTPIGFYRCLFAAIAFGFLASRQGLPHFKPALKLIILAGIFFSIDLYVWHRSVIYAGAGLGTILGNTQVFYTSLFGLIFLAERLKPRFWFAVILAFGGIYLLVDIQPTSSNRYTAGIIFGLLTGVVYAAYILCLRTIEKKEILSSAQLLALVSLVCAICLFGVSSYENSIRLPEGVEWIWLVGLALVAQVSGWWLITHNLPHVPISKAGLVLLTQPAIATILGAIIFSESMNGRQYCGAAFTFLAIYMGTTGKNRNINLPPAQPDKTSRR